MECCILLDLHGSRDVTPPKKNETNGIQKKNRKLQEETEIYFTPKPDNVGITKE